ncbi:MULTISPECIES: efflux RND transporter periplasmic adaptor subunit [unclassified Acidovorax]|jgi:membrane fusion protein, heavy metal efflux system|uniref:efflux RND transporter periplasmic adaptor subunit n=1 Tax=unclassified Acidovorax TaxID=2684926 RepID=UPI0010D5561C|nr:MULTISPECIES: efflux RND transporter periplasmic adaptor subunit [unclassified Acidovorax]MDA8520990.1 efflux RND transporter periplasmic adaptor subunit [Acidovorax sp. NCPPB 4044]GDY37504.1 resistance-nodulation-cell division (RND) divalent metal cation efflux membrane fusion protein CzcB [Acidovorax sp. NB1]
MNSSTTSISKKHLIAIAVVIAMGVGAGAFILKSGKPSTAGGDGHGHGAHAEEKGHGDGEHHGKGGGDGHGHDKGHEDGEHHEESQAKGPNGGSLFKEGDFSLEALLVEDGGEPRLRIWMSDKDKSLPAGTASVSATITRLTQETQKLTFTPEKGSWVSREVVAEPHAFEIEIIAQTATEPFMFVMSKEEGKVELTDAQIKAAAIGVDTASAATIKTALLLPGEIRLNEDRTSHVVPRLAGVVESVSANLGQVVKKGQILAAIASPMASEQRSELQTAQKRLALAKTTYDREKKLWEQKVSAEQDYLQAKQALSEAEVAVANAHQKLGALGLSGSSASGLNRLELRAPFDGVVIEKHISLGEAVKEDAAVFTISDLSKVWAEINVPAKDISQVRVGERVTIKATAFDASATGTVAFVGALIGEQTRTAKARVVLDNPKGAWRPGLFVNVEVVSEEASIPVTISADAVQSIGEKPVVFLKVNGGFIAQPVQLGRSDGKRVEVVRGLKAGMPYAAAGSFVVKSELGKGSAEHTH